MSSSRHSRLKVRVGACSHRGWVRKENQDRISRFRCSLGEVFAVVDGMGGHADGGRAAEVTLEILEKDLADAPPPVAEALQYAADRANRELHRLSSAAGKADHRMGATLVLVMLIDDRRRVMIAHAGDSRAYRMREGNLEPLTRDHTLVQTMVERGILNEKQAREHPDASVINRAFGQEPEIELEISEPFDLRMGDRFLLCSDGLCGYVDDPDIAQALRDTEGAQSATDRLIELALNVGGEDNVSVQVLELVGSPVEQKPDNFEQTPTAAESTSGDGTRSRLRFGLGLCILLVLVLAGWLAFHWMSEPDKSAVTEETILESNTFEVEGSSTSPER